MVRLELPSHIVEGLGEELKERIIELHHMQIAAIIRILRRVIAMDMDIIAEILRHLLADEGRVCISESIDALFGIADDQIAMRLAEALPHERREVLPLHSAGILELIDQEMIEPSAYSFIYKRSIAIADHLIEDHSGFRQLDGIDLIQVIAAHFRHDVEEGKSGKIRAIQLP